MGGGFLRAPRRLIIENMQTKVLVREIIIVVVVALAILIPVQISFRAFEVYNISMEPNIHEGQFILVNKAVYFFRSPHRGEVIVFHSPVADADWIKRIIGLPGERIKGEGGKVYIDQNGGSGRWEILDEPYLSQSTLPFTATPVIPADRYFVLGDNRAHSDDSRIIGPIPGGNIIGKAWVCYWPPSEWGLIRSYPLLAN